MEILGRWGFLHVNETPCMMGVWIFSGTTRYGKMTSIFDVEKIVAI